MTGTEVYQEEVGTQLAMTYIGRKQANVVQRVALRPIFEVCVVEKGYEGRVSRRELWWRKDAAEKQLS